MPVCHFMSCLCHACVSHLLRGQHHHLECYYRNFLIGTHMCVHPVSEWSVYFTLQCELFPSCNVSNNTSLVSARTRGGGGQPNVDRPGQRGGIPKIPKFVRTSFMDDPYVKSVCHLIVTNTIYLTYEKIINFLWHKFQKSLNEILQNYKDNIILHSARLKS